MACDAIVVSIGTELTRGELTNTNASWLSEQLTLAGAEVVEHVTVDDDMSRVVRLLARLADAAEIVVCTGGLGPTTDDLTAAAVAQYAGVPLVRDEASLEAIRARFARVGRTMSPSNEKQADFPRCARVMPNAEGTAPGFDLSLGRARAFFMPGVPREMKAMFVGQVMPALAAQLAPRAHQVHLRTFGLPESVVGERLQGLEAAHPGLTLGYRAHFPEIEVKVLVQDVDLVSATSRANVIADEVRARLGDVVFGGRDDSFGGAILRALRDRKQTLAIAESCTGGLAAHLITAEPGASQVLLAGLVPYANEAKQIFVGVDPELIVRHGAVSEPVARALAEQVRVRAGADLGLGITGIAGPSGGTVEKPVGTVFFAVASAHTTYATQRRFVWSRDFIQKISAYQGLDLVRRLAEGRLESS